MRIGYARVSTLDQNLDLQEDALKAAGAHVEQRIAGVDADIGEGHAELLGRAAEVAMHEFVAGIIQVAGEVDRGFGDKAIEVAAHFDGWPCPAILRTSIARIRRYWRLFPMMNHLLDGFAWPGTKFIFRDCRLESVGLAMASELGSGSVSITWFGTGN